MTYTVSSGTLNSSIPYHTFNICTDDATLTWLRRTPDPDGQQARWLEILEEYDFQMEHHPGVTHENADALLR